MCAMCGSRDNQTRRSLDRRHGHQYAAGGQSERTPLERKGGSQTQPRGAEAIIA